MLSAITLLVPPWGGDKVRFAGLTERGLRHLEALGWRRAVRGQKRRPGPRAI